MDDLVEFLHFWYSEGRGDGCGDLTHRPDRRAHRDVICRLRVRSARNYSFLAKTMKVNGIRHGLVSGCVGM